MTKTKRKRLGHGQSTAAASTEVAPPRLAGHCIVCNTMVERCEDGSCPAGHSPASVTGSIEVGIGQPLPRFPGFNWGAFLVPPIWGVAHGMWSGVFFLPLWAFVDSVIRSTSGKAIWLQVLAWLTFAVTLGFQFEFGRTANRLAWRRAAKRMTLEKFTRVQELWAVGGAGAFAALVAWVAIYLTR